MPVADIQKLVENIYDLSEEDWEPYTKTRTTNYPKWKHNLQTVLAEWKKEGIVRHEEDTNSYIFMRGNDGGIDLNDLEG